MADNIQIELFNDGEVVVFEPSKMLNVPSSTIHIENKISLLQKKLWFELVYNAFPKMGTQRKYSITLKRLREALGWNENTSNDTELKEALRGLNETTVSWNIFGKDNKNTSWQTFPLLAGCEIPKNSGVCIFEFSSFLEDRFLAMGEEAYVKIDLIISRKFQSKYALSIYCLALDYLMLEMGYSEKKFSIPELRKYLALKEGEYKLTADMNRWIIKPSEEEINKTSDMNIEIKPYKDGKKITGYKLCMSLKEGRIQEYLDRKNRLKQVSSNDKYLIEAPKPSYIKFENPVINKFLLENTVSITTDTIQAKLKELKSSLKDNLDDYILFLLDYFNKEHQKGSIKNKSGFFISLLRDDNQIDNYMVYLVEKTQKEQEKEKVLEKHVKLELENKYESFLAADFQNYIIEHLDLLEDKITQFIDKHIKAGSLLHDSIIQKKMNGNFTIKAYKELSKSQQLIFLVEFKKHKPYFNYHPLSFSEWKVKHVTKEELELIKESLKNKI